MCILLTYMTAMTCFKANRRRIQAAVDERFSEKPLSKSLLRLLSPSVGYSPRRPRECQLNLQAQRPSHRPACRSPHFPSIKTGRAKNFATAREGAKMSELTVPADDGAFVILGGSIASSRRKCVHSERLCSLHTAWSRENSSLAKDLGWDVSTQLKLRLCTPSTEPSKKLQRGGGSPRPVLVLVASCSRHVCGLEGGVVHGRPTNVPISQRVDATAALVASQQWTVSQRCHPALLTPPALLQTAPMAS